LTKQAKYNILICRSNFNYPSDKENFSMKKANHNGKFTDNQMNEMRQRAQKRRVRHVYDREISELVGHETAKCGEFGPDTFFLTNEEIEDIHSPYDIDKYNVCPGCERKDRLLNHVFHVDY